MIRQQLKYEMELYFRGTGFVMPFIVIAVFLYFMYSMKPLDVMSGYLTTCIFVFSLMVWIGMAEGQKENLVQEQVLYLKIGSACKYYVGKAGFFVVLALMISAVCSVFPFIQNQLNGGDMFLRQLLPADLLNAFILQAGCGICGVALGGLLHPRIVADRKTSIALTVLLAILAVCSLSMTDKVPVLKLLLWVLPPIMLPQQTFASQDYFNLKQSLLIFGVLLLYSLVYFVIKSLICERKKF